MTLLSAAADADCPENERQIEAEKLLLFGERRSKPDVLDFRRSESKKKDQLLKRDCVLISAPEGEVSASAASLPIMTESRLLRSL